MKTRAARVFAHLIVLCAFGLGLASSALAQASQVTTNSATQPPAILGLAATTTTVDAQSTLFSAAAQAVTLTATVTETSGGAPVSDGSVTFQVKDGATDIGTAEVDGTLTASGVAEVSYTLPAATPVGSYTIEASYTDGESLFMDSMGSNTLTVDPTSDVTFSKTFGPDTIGPGSTTTLTFTITNPDETPVSDLAFTDVLPAGITIATPASAATDCPNAVLSAPDGGTTITLSDGDLGADASCTITVNVVGTATATNVSGDLTSSAGNSGAATATLTVDDALPGFSKAFVPSTIPPGGTSTLTFTIDNDDNASAVTSMSFRDVLPPGVDVADLPNATTDCGLGTVTISDDPGTNSIFFSAGSVGPMASCTVKVDVTAPAPGVYVNTSGELEAVIGLSKVATGFATAALDVPVAFLTKSFLDDPVPPGGTVTLKFTLQNPDRDNPATSIAFSDDLGTTLTGLVATGLPLDACGGTLSTTDGGSTIDFADGSLGPGEMCMFEVELDVPDSADSGSYTNTTTSITAMIDGEEVTGDPAMDILVVSAAPIFTKEFIDDPVGSGSEVTLRFTITNTNPDSPLTDIEFSDDLETALAGLAANDLVSGVSPSMMVHPLLDVCGDGSELGARIITDFPPIFIADPTDLVFTGGSLAAAGEEGDSCTFDVILDVPAGTPTGTYTNTTSELTGEFVGERAGRKVQETTTALPASDDLVVVGAPTLTKDFTNDPVEPGEVVILEFTITHSINAETDATDIEFDDDLGAVLSGLAVSTSLPVADVCGPGSSLGGTASVPSLTGGSLSPGESCTFAVGVMVPAAAPGGTYLNTTSDVTATVLGEEVTGIPANDNLEVTSLLFTKEFTDDPVGPGGTVTLKFSITNTTAFEATGIEFIDTIDAMLSGIGVVTSLPLDDPAPCGDGSSFGFEEETALGKSQSASPLKLTGGNLDPGETCMFEVELSIPGGTAPGEYFNSTSELTATIDSEEVTAPPATDNLLVSAPLTFLKEFTDDPAIPGDQVTLKFTISNLTGVDLTDITFTDDLDAALENLAPADGELPATVCGGMLDESPAGTLDFSGGALLSGETCMFSVVLDVPEDAEEGIYTNVTSEIDAEGGTPPRLSGKVLETITGDPATDDLEVLAVPVIRKAFSGDPVAPGGTVTLEFTITNASPSTLATDIAFMDDLDAVLAGLEVTSFEEIPEGGGFEPMEDVCGEGSVLTLTEPAKLILTGGRLIPSTDCTFSVTVAVPEDAAPGSYLNETTELTATVDDVEIEGNTATDELDVEALPLLVKAFTDDPVGPGGTVTLKFTLTNTDQVNAASDLAFTDDLSAVIAGLELASVISNGCGGTVGGTSTISFSGGSLGAGESCMITVSLTVPEGTEAGSYTNTTSAVSATIGGSAVEGSPATDALVVVAVPVLTKSFTDDPVLPGGEVTLEFTLTYGEATASATDIAFTDDLDAVLTGLVASGLPLTSICGADSRIEGTSELSFTGGSLDPGGECTFSVTLQVPAGAEPGTYTNEVDDLTAGIDGLTVSGEPATDNLQVQAITFTKEFIDDPVTPGGTVTLKFTITNNDASTATAISFMDNLEALVPGISVDTPSLPLADACGDGSTFGFATTAQGKNQGGQTIAPPLELIGGTLDSGEMCMFEIVLKIPSSADPGDYTNVTSELTATIDSEPVTTPPATDDLIIASPLTLLKAFTDDPVAPGAMVTLEFTLSYEADAGEPDATDIAFTDDLDAVLSGLVASTLPDDGFCGPGSTMTGTSVLTMTGGTLSPGETCVFSVVLDVPATADPGTYENVTSDVEGEVEDAGRPSGKTLATITGDPATDDLEVSAIPVLRKEFTDDPVAPGGTVTLEFTITNTNTTEEATDIGFTDDLDGVLSGLVAVGLPVSDVCGTGSTLTGTGLLELTGGTLPPGDSCTFSVTLMVPAGAALDTYTNTTGALTAEVDGTSVTGNMATDDLNVEGLPLLAKEFTDDPAAPGGTVTLEFTITNTDPDNAASDIAFTDDLSVVIAGMELAGVISNDCGGTVSGTGTISFSGGSLGAGESCTITVSLTIPAGVSEGFYTNTTSTVTAQVGGSSVTGAPASDDVEIIAIPVLSKAFTDDPVMPGSPVTLEFVISHEEGMLDATDLAFTDALDAILTGLEMTALLFNDCGGTVSGTGTISFSGGSLTAGSICTIRVTLSVPGTATPGSTVTNTTSALTADVGGTDVTGNMATDDLLIAGLLSLTKEFTDDPVAPGGTVTLVFTLTNNDPDDPATGIAFTDDLDAVIPGLELAGVISNDCGGTVSGTGTISFSGGSLGADDTCTISVELDVPDTADPTDYTNITSAATATIDGETATSLQATDELTVTEALIFTKAFTDDPVQPGETVTLKFTISFVGEADATDITFTDDLDAALSGLVAVGLPADDVCGDGSTLTGTDVLTLTGGSLEPGAMCMFTVTLQVPTGATDGAYPNETSDIEAQVDGETVTGDPATDELVVVTEAMLDVTKDDELVVPDGEAKPGDRIKYTVEITNDGDRPATEVMFSDTVDSNTALDCGSVTPTPTTCDGGAGGSLTFDLGTLEPDDMVTIMFEVEINSPYPANAPTVENQGLVEGGNFDEIPTDDPDTEEANDATATEVTRESDFSLTKTADSTSPEYQSTVTFTLIVTNNGPVPSAAEVTDVLPDGLVLVDVDPEAGYDEGTGTWTTDVIDVGKSLEFTITALVDTIEPVTNEASVEGTDFPDPVPGNNTDDSGLITPVAADLAIIKSLTGFSGDPETNMITATFKLTVTNNGPSDATGVFVEDELPEGATLETIPTGYDPVAGIWTIGDLSNGSSTMLTLVMVADAEFNLLNIAIVEGDQPDQEDSNNLAAAQAQHDNSAAPSTALSADLSLRITVDNEMPEVGDTITYSIDLTNDGPSPTAGVAVRAALAESQEFVSAAISPEVVCKGCGYDDSLGVWTVGHLLKEATKTLEIRVVVGGQGEFANAAEVIQSYLPDPDSQPDNGEAEDDDYDSIMITVLQPTQTRGLQAQATLMEAAEVPTEFELGANYPNPFNPETTIPFAVPEKSHVQMAVYDLLGREVALLLDDERAAGRYALTWRADNLPTGVYIVRMQAGAIIMTQRVVLLK